MRRAAAALPLLLALVLAARTVTRDSCTVDEFGNLPLAVVFWDGALHVDPGNPPLTRWIQGIPLLVDRPAAGVTDEELAETQSSWDLGYAFEAAHRDDYHAVLVRARWPSVVLLLLTVLGVWRWAKDLAGDVPAVGAALLAAASPDLLAHGRLVTPDIGVACFTVWAGWTASRGRAMAAGALAGAAVLSKFGGLLLLPILGVVMARRGWKQALAFVGAALVVVFAGYGFAAPGTLRGVPLPFPAPMLHGIAAQLDEGPYPAYLLGQLREGGWHSYYLVAMLVKVPLAALALFVLGAMAARRERLGGAVLPGVLALAWFAAFSAATAKNTGLRYVLPVIPLLCIVAAPAFREAATARRVLAGVLLVLAVASGVSASAAPIAWFNGVERLLGGKRAVLVDSNLDWGQALPDLREWMEREGLEAVQLAYFGRVDPTLYGIRWVTLPERPARGAVAVSATLAVGRPYTVRFKERISQEAIPAWSGERSWTWVRDLEPDAELGGGAILVWRDIALAKPR